MSLTNILGRSQFCLGNSFAMLEAWLILLTGLPRFSLHLSPGQKVRAKSGLPMRIQPR